MKKSILLLGMAIMGITSCTNDEVLEVKNNEKAIGFQSFVNKGTRADVKTGELKNFWVQAQYGDEYKSLFTSAENVYLDGTEWKYTNTKYWTANTYYFVAYADDNTSITAPGYVTINNGSLSISNFSPTYTAGSETTAATSSTKDIVADVVETTGGVTRTDAVDFTFNHLLSKVTFTVVNTGEFPMEITALKITGLKQTGSITMAHNTDLTSDPIWRVSGEDVTIYPIAQSSSNIAKNGRVASAEFLLIPQALDNVKFEIMATFYSSEGPVSYKDFTGTNAGFIKTASYDSWLAGNVYNYTISLPSAAQPIEFNVSSTGVTPWNAVSATGIELNP